MSEYTRIRIVYTGPALDMTEAPDPMHVLHEWLEEALASGIAEPNAMVLSTVDSLGQPSSRVVLLRSLSDKGLEFYTNYTSRKAVEMADNPQVALLFFWSSLHRQVRIEGHVEVSDKTTSDEYFNDRPRDHQIGAWASPQSATIPDRKSIEENVVRFERMFEGRDVPRPSFWGGYVVIPHQMEFWQGRESRLHDRYRFQKNESGWKVERLAP